MGFAVVECAAVVQVDVDGNARQAALVGVAPAVAIGIEPFHAVDAARRRVAAPVAEIDGIDRAGGRERDHVGAALVGAREGLDEPFGHDLADDVRSGGQALDRVEAGLVEVGVGIVGHRDGVRLAAVEDAVVVDVDVDDDAGEPRLIGVALAIAIGIEPLLTVKADRLEKAAVPEVDAVEHHAGQREDGVGAVVGGTGERLHHGGRHDLADLMAARRRQSESVVACLVDVGHRQIGHGDGPGLATVERAVAVQVGIDGHARQARLVAVALTVAIGVDPLDAADVRAGRLDLVRAVEEVAVRCRRADVPPQQRDVQAIDDAVGVEVEQRRPRRLAACSAQARSERADVVDRRGAAGIDVADHDVEQGDQILGLRAEQAARQMDQYAVGADRFGQRPGRGHGRVVIRETGHVVSGDIDAGDQRIVRADADRPVEPDGDPIHGRPGQRHRLIGRSGRDGIVQFRGPRHAGPRIRGGRPRLSTHEHGVHPGGRGRGKGVELRRQQQAWFQGLHAGPGNVGAPVAPKRPTKVPSRPAPVFGRSNQVSLHLAAPTRSDSEPITRQTRHIIRLAEMYSPY